MANEGVVRRGEGGEVGGGGVEAWVGRGESVRRMRGWDKIGQWV